MAFSFKTLKLPGLLHIETSVFPDDRGSFSEMYKLPDFQKAGIPKPFVQVNQSVSKKNVLRGLHYQILPSAQGKLICVLQGVVFDVAVDVRRGSPFFGKWAGVELSAQKQNMLYVPEGFAHGFCVLSEMAQVVYHCTAIYDPRLERGINWQDADVGITWPVKDPIVSSKDKLLPDLKSADINFSYET